MNHRRRAAAPRGVTSLPRSRAGVPHGDLRPAHASERLGVGHLGRALASQWWDKGTSGDWRTETQDNMIKTEILQLPHHFPLKSMLVTPRNTSELHLKLHDCACAVSTKLSI